MTFWIFMYAWEYIKKVKPRLFRMDYVIVKPPYWIGCYGDFVISCQWRWHWILRECIGMKDQRWSCNRPWISVTWMLVSRISEIMLPVGTLCRVAGLLQYDYDVILYCEKDILWKKSCACAQYLCSCAECIKGRLINSSFDVKKC